MTLSSRNVGAEVTNVSTVTETYTLNLKDSTVSLSDFDEASDTNSEQSDISDDLVIVSDTSVPPETTTMTPRTTTAKFVMIKGMRPNFIDEASSSKSSITQPVPLGKPSKKNCVFYDIVIIRETTHPPSLIRT